MTHFLQILALPGTSTAALHAQDSVAVQLIRLDATREAVVGAFPKGHASRVGYTPAHVEAATKLVTTSGRPVYAASLSQAQTPEFLKALGQQRASIVGMSKEGFTATAVRGIDCVYLTITRAQDTVEATLWQHSSALFVFPDSTDAEDVHFYLFRLE